MVSFGRSLIGLFCLFWQATPALAPTLELVPRVAAPPHVLDTLKPDLSLMLEEPWLSDVAFAGTSLEPLHYYACDARALLLELVRL